MNELDAYDSEAQVVRLIEITGVLLADQKK